MLTLLLFIIVSIHFYFLKREFLLLHIFLLRYFQTCISLNFFCSRQSIYRIFKQ